jgi:multimeric flavodoxin WrbA
MILILNGSPNKASKTMSIVHELLKNEQDEVKIINSYESNIISCDDCQYCNKIIGCPKEDDFEKISQLLHQCSTLIIASPVYFGGLSDQMMKIINRFQQYFSQKMLIKDKNYPRPKNIIFITTQGSKKRAMNHGPRQTFNILKSLFAPQESIQIFISNSDDIHPLKQKKTARKIAKIKRKIINF